MNAQATITYLRDQQAADGSFGGLASPTIEPFAAKRKQATIFPTMLILDCLHDAVGAEDVRLKATKYLQSQVSTQGSWNYWDKASQAKRQEPYPDDLDDTACALAALARSDPNWLTGFRLGQFARLLVAAEGKPGGPYNTWLINTAKAPQWQHVDLAVNANIGYALSLQSVELAGLTNYLDAAIEAGSLTSDYYVGEAPVLYFLSRWYKGSQLAALRAKVTQLITGQAVKSALQQALLLSAGCKVGLAKAQLRPLAEALQASCSAGHWPAAALYVDPVYNKQQHFGGSKALTTAFALEALTAYDSLVTDAPVVITRRRGEPRLMVQVKKDAASITNTALRHRYLDTARQVMYDAAGEQITAAATLVAQAGGWTIPSTTLTQLNLASVNGWMAYTIYDDVLDGQGEVDQINVANLALRRSLGHFMAAIPDDPKFAELVTATFDTIDGANDWEQQHARAVVKNGQLQLQTLPDYGDYTQLAERSLGHSLAACAVAYLHHGSLDHRQVVDLQTFFKHFLIARQLNDDAHDWEADLQAGQLSAIVTMLLRDKHTVPPIDDLRQHFWQHTIGETAALIREHIRAAQQVLDGLADQLDPTVFMGWLDTLEASVTAALQGRDEALQFIQAYEGSHA
ncbi:MAG: hypothetical protein JWN82_397 [Candidatus Saccharibacteria bacterium]|nr:hypothetical protein [Candidatus Saccharibacteria bacterium]